MRSTKFSCERTLFKKDLTRFWPLWAAYTLLWFLLIPLNVFNQGERLARAYAELGLSGWAGHKAMEAVCQHSGAIIALIYGILCAMAVWSYLYSPRAANTTHALPVRREGQFLAHFLSGLTFSALPHAIILVLTLIAGLATGSRGDFLNAAGAMGIQTLLCLFYFSLATLCAFATGHLVALPVFYGIVNFLVFGLANLIDWVASQFLFGFTTALSRSAAVRWLTPAQCLNRQPDWMYDFTGSGAEGSTSYLYGIPAPENGSARYTVTTRVDGLETVLIYAAAALVLAGLALLLYRRRQLETAGDVVAVPWLRPVFQYGVAFCAALLGTYMLADLLGRRDRIALTVLLVLWGVLGFFAARMLLKKTLRVFRTGWKGAAAVAAAIVVLCLGLVFDVFGLERAIPDADRVVSVLVQGPDSSPGDSARYPHFTTEDPALIQKLMAVHQSVIDHRQELKSTLDSFRREADIPVDTRFRSFHVEYELDNGSYLDRDYNYLAVYPEDMEDPSSVASAMSTLLADRDFVRLAYGLEGVEADRLTEVGIRRLENVSSSENTEVGEVIYYSPLSDRAALEQSAQDEYEYRSSDLRPVAVEETRSDENLSLRPASTEELAALWRAVEADFDAGNLGRRWIFADNEEFNKNTCPTDLSFYWNKRMEDVDGEVYYVQECMTVNLTPQAEHTLAALDELGLFENGVYISTYGSDEPVYTK